MRSKKLSTLELPTYEVVAEPLTESAFEPYGQACIPPPVSDGMDGEKGVGGIDLFRDDGEGTLHMEICKVRMLPELMTRTNRHWGFTQFFGFMRGKFAVIVADPEMSKEDYDPGSTRVFIADAGTSVAIRRETWHVEPCGLLPASILAISQTETMFARTEAIEELGDQAIVRFVVPGYSPAGVNAEGI